MTIRSFGKEHDIFEAIREISTSRTVFLTETEDEKALMDSVRFSPKWVDNSANTLCPPDYYNDKDGLAIEFMRIVGVGDGCSCAEYRSEFRRVFNNHDHKVASYRHNHPECRIALALCDISGRWHCESDAWMLDAIKDSNADFVIWYRPYITAGEAPALVVINIKELQQVQDWSLVLSSI